MLEIKGLKVSFHTYSGEVQAVRGVDLALEEGGILAIVGESGCGKTVTAQSILRLHDPSVTHYKEGRILLDGKDLLSLDEKQIARIRGKEIRMTDAVALLRLRPSRVRIRLILKEETVRSQNIVVTVPGKSRKEEIIAAGAHYDSVPFSYGSWDNGAGTVQMLSLLEALKEKAPKRTVRVIFFGSEETGLKGSRAYLEAHQEETENIKLMINADVGGSILGKEILFVGAGPEAEGFLRSFLKEVGYEAVLFSKLMSSDSANFNDYGIPSISIGQGAPRGGGYMHTRYDNMDLMDENVLEAEAAFLIKLTERLAGAEVIPVPGYIPEALRKQVIEYFGQEKSVLARTPSLPDPKPLKQHF